MRNIPQHISKEFGKDVLAILRKFESINMKICDYKNHRRFSLRCLSNSLTLVSLKLKNNIRIHKSDCIIQKAEKGLLSKRVRNINNILNHLEHDRYMYCQKLSAILVQDLSKECKGFIGDLKETRHLKIMEWQKRKFESLWHRKQHSISSNKNVDKHGHSKQVQKPSVQNTRAWWIVTYPTPPYDTQEKLLSHGPNCSCPKDPLQRMHNSNWSSMLRSKPHWCRRAQSWYIQDPQVVKPPKPNLTREECVLGPNHW